MGGGLQSGAGSSGHNGSSVSLPPHPLASSPLWSLVHLPHPGQLSRPFPFLKNFILSVEIGKQHPDPGAGNGREQDVGFLLCLWKDWEVKGLMGAVKPIPNKACNKPQALPPVWEAKYHQSFLCVS